MAVFSPPALPFAGPFSTGTLTCATSELTYVSSDAITQQVALPFLDIFGSALRPVLQREDGTYIGAIGPIQEDSLDPLLFLNSPTIAAVGPEGVVWQTNGADALPLYTTADGGFVGTSTEVYMGGVSNLQSGPLGQLFTFDQNGNITSIAPDTGSQLSWSGSDYQSGSCGSACFTINEMSTNSVPANLAIPLSWSFVGANLFENSASPLCRDDRDQLIAEYVTYNSGFLPICSQFTPSSVTKPSLHFAFADLNISDINYPDFPDWAILKPAMLTGLESTLTYYNDSVTLTSAYRTPKVQNHVNAGVPTDRHVHGDAVDINAGTPAVYFDQRVAAKQAKACVEPVDPNNPKLQHTYNHTHADWRAIDHESWPWPCPQGW